MAQANVIHGKNWTARDNGQDFDDTLPQTLHPSLWSRLRRVFRWEDLIVAGKQVKGFVVSPAIAAVILGFVLTTSVGIYWRTTARIDAQSDLIRDQEKLIIRLDQRLIDKNERDLGRKEEMEKRLQNIDAVQIVLGRDIAKLQAQRRN